MAFDHSVAARGAVIVESVNNFGEKSRWVYFLEGSINVTIEPEYPEFYPDVLLFERPSRLSKLTLESYTSGGFMYQGDMPTQEDMQRSLDIPQRQIGQ